VGVLNITAAVWTAGFHWWRSGNKKRTQNVSEYINVINVELNFQNKTALYYAKIVQTGSGIVKMWMIRYNTSSFNVTGQQILSEA